MKKTITSLALTVFAAVTTAQTISTESTNTNTNNNTSSSTSTNRNISESTSTVKSPPPTAVAPAVTTINNDVCAVVASGAVQTQIFGISMGGTMRDMNCERIKLAKNLFDMGMKVAAVATLCQDERVFAAMMAAGTPCPVDGKIGAQAREEWEARGIRVDTDKVGAYAVPSPAPRTVDAVVLPASAVREGCDYTGDDPIVQRRVCGK
jgi:hypothetical protein